jgi:uncharacterized protein (UPF0332 family)
VIGPDQLMALAEALVQAPSEEEWRAAVSRAYYAAFHTARDLLADLGFRVPRAAQAHSYLWMRLSNCGDPTVTLAGVDLNNLQRERNRADYDVHLTVTQAHALQWVQTARLVLTRLRSAFTDPVRTNVTAAMRDYERNVLGAVTWQGP